MKNKENIKDELYSLDASQLALWKEHIHQEQVEQSYLENNKALLLSIVSLPQEKEHIDHAYLASSKAKILDSISKTPSSRARLRWLRPLAVAASVLVLLTITTTILSDDRMQTSDFSSIDTDEIMLYLDEEMNHLDTEELYSLLDTETDLELDVDISEDDAIEMIYDDLSLETIEYYY